MAQLPVRIAILEIEVFEAAPFAGRLFLSSEADGPVVLNAKIKISHGIAWYSA